jgi:serine/threonine protein kinase/tetratricopeptide (TPR) repeat protein
MTTTVFQRLGPYEIVAEIGRGGMAAVFLATDTRTNQRVALKLVPTGNDREARDILDAEHWGAKLQEQFSRISQYVPAVYEHGFASGYFYLAMEYLQGRNLSEIISDGPLSPERASRIAIQLCDFLEAAHGFETTIDGRQLRALLHGDLKPRNIRVIALDGADGAVGAEQIKILDFGIAKALSFSRKVTHNDFGSIAYLSPERLESGDIDQYSDFWAIGVLLYEMASGVAPFRALDTRRLEQRIRSRHVDQPLDSGCPAGLQAVVAKLLAPTPAERYDSAKAIRDDLQLAAAGQPTLAERQGWPAKVLDEAPTRRTHPPADDVEDVTRRTTPSASVAPLATAAPPVSAGGKWMRRVKVALLAIALLMVTNEIRVGMLANQVAATVAERELDDMQEAWNRYDALKGGGMRLAVTGLERTLVSHTTDLTDRVIANYRTPTPTVRETQWNLARESLDRAAAIAPRDRRLKAALRYCEGHLHRINGEAQKTRRKTVAAQQEFTEAVAAFREAAELRPNWADPFLGLSRVFIYGLEDVDRGADALKQAEKFGFTPGDRETLQLADGYRTRADALARTAKALAGMAQEQEYLTRALEAYSQSLKLYSTVATVPGVTRTIRIAERGQKLVEQRIAELAHPSAQPEASMSR